jgi:hypothetical protein
MKPLDLTEKPPRSPREQLAGIVFTARVVDKLRAALPGGELNGFFPFNGFSEVWQHYSGVNLRELFGVVGEAPDEAAVVAWLEERFAGLDKDAVNAKLAGFNTARIPESWRTTFDAVYPQELRERHTVLFDLLDADDKRLFALR